MERKKLLIVTYYWPPVAGSGVQRWLKFTKYLRDFGWEPIVYTVSNPDFTLKDETLLSDIPKGVQIIKTPIWEPFDLYAKFVGRKKDEKVNPLYFDADKKPALKDRLAVWIRGNVFIPDSRMFWIRPSVKFLTKWLKENKIDAFVTTGPPHSMHAIGLGVKKNTGLPWLADFRDPWTQIGFYRELKLSWWADRRHKSLEQQTLKLANKVVVVSNTMKTELQEIVNVPMEVISNGYDEDDFKFDNPAQPDEKFTIVHVGMLGKPRNHEAFWKVVAEETARNPELAQHLEIRFYGKTDPDVEASVRQYNLQNWVKFLPYLKHKEILEVERNAALLYLSINNTNNPKSILTGKLFEYLALQRPILGIGPIDGDAADILNATSAGRISDFYDEAGFRQNLYQLFTDWKNRTPVQSSGYLKYSRRNLTAEMAAVLNDMVKAK